METFSLVGRTAFVTGGNSGIGRSHRVDLLGRFAQGGFEVAHSELAPG
jgi:NAD(P)-dependent dehydrogenase (short-subunit alcohol dehydrogenase family)